MKSPLPSLRSQPSAAPRPSVSRPRAWLTLALGAFGLASLALVGCGADKPKPSQTAADASGDDMTTAAPAEPKPEPSIRPLEDNPGAAVSSDQGQRGSARDEEYTVTPNDCLALANAYGRSWQNDEMAKLNAKNLKPAQQERYAGQIRQGAKEAHDNWLSECQNLVDSAMLYGRLACATKAKSLQRFNDCWDGKVDD